MAEEFKPKVVLALIENHGKIALIRRRVPVSKVEWAFPGGVSEPGEMDLQTAEREAKQEVGLTVKAAEKLLERKHPNTLVQISYVHCQLADGENLIIGEPEEIAEAVWVTASQVLDKFTSDVHPTIREFLKKYG